MELLENMKTVEGAILEVPVKKEVVEGEDDEEEFWKAGVQPLGYYYGALAGDIQTINRAALEAVAVLLPGDTQFLYQQLCGFKYLVPVTILMGR